MKRTKLLVTLAAACLFGTAAADGAQRGRRHSQAERGRVVYEARCARCHGGDGLGQTTVGKLIEAPDLTDAKWQAKRTNSRMISSVTRGRGQMPAFDKKLTRSEIAAAIAFIRTLKK